MKIRNRFYFSCIVLFTVTQLSAQSVIYESGGKVGIGTSAPTAKLQIQSGTNGSATTFRDINIGGLGGWTSGEEHTIAAVYSNGDVGRINFRWNAGIGASFNIDNLLFPNASSSGKVFTVLCNGNVGIGNEVPDARLRVDGSGLIFGEGNGLLVDTLPAASARTGFMKYGGYEGMYVAGRDTLLRLAHRTDSPAVSGGTPTIREDLVVAASGNVGVGTITPNYRLEVSGGSIVSNIPWGHPWGYGVETNAAWAAWARQYSFFASDGTQLAAFGATGSSGNTLDHIFIGQGYNTAAASGPEWLVIKSNGNVGIGTTNPMQKLSVNGTIRAKEVIVETSGWSDYVFAENYVLQPLAEVEAQIKQDKHLPGIPSAQQVAESGIGLGEMQAKLLAKIEELTLHQIEQEKQLRAQAVLVTAQGHRIETLESENRELRGVAK